MTKPTKAGAKKAKLLGCSCGGYLDEWGYCATGGGYPITQACPLVCPLCRSALTWGGGCTSCKGTSTRADRTSWTFPGDLYEVQRGHWVKVGGPQKACTPDQNKACALIVDKVLAGELKEPEAQEKIQDILNPVPF